jgi:hypothetical protein
MEGVEVPPTSRASRADGVQTATQYVLNVSPIEFEDAEVRVGILRYESSEQLAGLRSTHGATHVFRRAEGIVIVFYDSYSFGRAVEVGHGEEARRLEAIQKAMKRKLVDLAGLIDEQSLKGFGYVGMAVNLLFLATAKAEARLDRIKRRLAHFLCDAAEQRIVGYH